MKRILYALPAILLVFALLVSCSEEEINASDTLSVAAFYPIIVMNNTEVVITGTGMDQVTEVVFPGDKVSKEFVVLDDTRLKVIAPEGVSTEPGVLVLKTTEKEISSRQTIRAAVPTLSYLNPGEKVATYANLIVVGQDLLLVETIQFIGGDDTAEVKALSFIRKSNSQLNVIVPANAPVGNSIQVRLTFKNGETMDLGTLNVEKGQKPGGHWESKEIVVYGGDPIDVGGWNKYANIGADKFVDAKTNDILRVYISDSDSGAQGSLKNGASWAEISPGSEYFDITAADKANGYYDWTIDEEMLGQLKVGGVIVGGQKYIITKVVYITQVWVEGGDESLTDPITEATIMLNDYEPHDGHDASWDMSWADASATEAVKDDGTGNTYIKLVKNVSGWTLNCNHLDHGTVQGIENYVVKLDILVEDGVTVPAAGQGAQWVLADDWKWYGNGLIPETTNGKWITIRSNCSDLGLSGDLVIGKKTNGLAGTFPAGVCFDNLRLDPKE